MSELDKRRLYWEMLALEDEATAGNRLNEIDGQTINKITEFIQINYEQCLEMTDSEPELDIDDIIELFRNLVRTAINNPHTI